MQPAGSKQILARWREVGEWWSGEPQREITRYIDEQGIRREEVRELAPVVSLQGIGPPKPYVENNSEEVSLRIRKSRDEKVAKACGYGPSDIDGLTDLKSRFDDKGKNYADDSYIDSLRELRERRYYGSAKRIKEKGVGPESSAYTKEIPVAVTTPGDFAALHIRSGYAFGSGTMLAEEIPVLAAHMGIRAAAITDPHSLVGAVEFVKRAQAVGIKPMVGAEIELAEGGRIVLIARSKMGYQCLSQLITACHLEEPRLYPLGSWERLRRFSRDLLCLTGGDDGPIDRLLLRGRYEEAGALLERLIDLYGKSNVFIEVERSYLPWEIGLTKRLQHFGDSYGVMCVAGGAVTHARPEHYPASDILTCVETLCTVEEVIGRKPTRADSQPPLEPRPARALNAERYLRSREEIVLLYEGHEELLQNTMRVADRCDDDVLPARTQLPETFSNPGQMLREVVWTGARERHGKIVLELRKRLEHELDRIISLNFAGHFLTIWDACNWARGEGILFSGRGSVVDSAVAYCMGISRIDGYGHNLHFDRFLPEDGSKRPDIDIDFEAKRRDDVRNYLTRKYGEDHVATVAAIGAYCSRGIIREVGKALGLPNELIGFLSKRLHGGVTPDQLESALEKRPELMNSGIPKERFRWVFELSERLMDVPRNMRAHSSGVVISSRPLAETVPVMWSASVVGGEEVEHLRIIQWDKRSAKYFFDKFDILCLRGQDVLSGVQKRVLVQTRAINALQQRELAAIGSQISEAVRQFHSPSLSNNNQKSAEQTFDVESISLQDEETYRAMRSGELIGIPQSASPAMRQAHIRLRTQDLHDASLVQAGIRPGVGGAVKINELIARRRGKPYTFDHPELERILGLTYGIIVFQEQVDQLLQTFAGCSSGEAEDLREAIHKRRREDYGRMMKEQILGRIVSNGHSKEIAEQVFDYVAGFKGYGFAQGHALAFAEISIRSIYCQQNFPAEYFASLLSAQPAGYYGPCTLANEARSRGVRMLHPDVNASDDLFTVEDVKSDTDPKIILPNSGIRVGLMQVYGLSEEKRQKIVEERQMGNYQSFFDFAARIRPSRDELESLIFCGALDCLCPNRRAMLWAIPQAQHYAESIANLNALAVPIREPDLPLTITDFSDIERAIHERRCLDLDIYTHLMVFERERIRAKGGITAIEAKQLPNRRKAIVVGNPIRLRFPPTPSGKRVVFFDLEDETGLLNVTCFDAVYRRDGHAIVCSPYVTLIGEAQDRDGHTAFLAKRVFPYNPVIAHSVGKTALPIGTADFLVG